MYNQIPRSLAFAAFSYDPKDNVVFLENSSGSPKPAYVFNNAGGVSQSQIQVSRLSANHGWRPQRPLDIGLLHLHTHLSKVDLYLHGGSTTMRLNSTRSSSHKFGWAPYGSLQWKQNFSGSEMRLIDGFGRLVAKVRRSQRSASIEIFVPGDECFVDMVVVTAVAKMRQQRKETKDAASGSDVHSALPMS